MNVVKKKLRVEDESSDEENEEAGSIDSESSKEENNDYLDTYFNNGESDPEDGIDNDRPIDYY